MPVVFFVFGLVDRKWTKLSVELYTQAVQSPLINILTRTSDGRKDLFTRCIQSVKAQTYKNIRIIVSADSTESLNYAAPILAASSLNWHLHQVVPKPKPFYWNLYCNDLKSLVTDGWFFYLDSDDYLVDRFAVERIVKKLPQKGGLICQFLRNGSPKPNQTLFRRQAIIRGGIGGSCILLQAHHKQVAHWQARKAADFFFISDVAKEIHLTWVKEVLVCAGNRGLFGRNPKAIQNAVRV